MKIVPILVVTNVLALALVAMLYFEQQDLRARVSSSRSTAAGRNAPLPAEDPDAMEARVLARLRAELARERPGVGVVAEAPGENEDGDAAVAGNGAGEPARPRAMTGEDFADLLAAGPEGPTIQGERMEAFRRNVRAANELNRREDEVRQVVERVDQLAAENRIAPLNSAQKESVAETVIGIRTRMGGLWRELREDPAIRQLSGEERGKAMRARFESVRSEALQSLETVVPAADAETILNNTLRGGGDTTRGAFAGPDRGARPTRGPGRGAGAGR